jgi:hypothetical protein
MRRFAVVALAAVLTTGCSGVVTKSFKVFADPPDSVIRVVSGTDLKEQTYRSPARVTADVPTDPALAAKAVVEVRKDNYSPKIIALADVQPGSTLNVKLEKIVQNFVKYNMKFRLVSPVPSNELRYRDKDISVSLTVGDQSFQMRADNLSDHDFKILWERAEYTDINKQRHRIMPSTVRFQNRNNPLPEQTIPAKGSIEEAVIPISSVFPSQQKKGYELRPLFDLGGEAGASLKGKSFILFIPVEIDRAITPYNFKIEITDAVKAN